MIAIEQIASALPARCLTTEELRAEYPDWDFDRLEKRTGVLRRYVAAEGETALDFAMRACEELNARGVLRPEEIDAVIFCTQSPDYVMPPNACLVHGQLGLKASALAFDITLACSGYIYGLQLGASLIGSGAARRVLLATADTYTRFIQDLPMAEASAILNYLFLHVQRPEFGYRHRWEEGNLLVWDNRSVMHHAAADYDDRRVMHRISVIGPL